MWRSIKTVIHLLKPFLEHHQFAHAREFEHESMNEMLYARIEKHVEIAWIALHVGNTWARFVPEIQMMQLPYTNKFLAMRFNIEYGVEKVYENLHDNMFQINSSPTSHLTRAE